MKNKILVIGLFLGIISWLSYGADTVKVEGTLLKKDKSPVVGMTIYVFKIVKEKEETSISMEFKDGKVVNPYGETDKKGRFIIQMNRSFIEGGQRFTLGIISGLGFKVIRQNGAQVEFEIDEKTNKINIGEIILKE
jgi:hypothetical protein